MCLWSQNGIDRGIFVCIQLYLMYVWLCGYLSLYVNVIGTLTLLEDLGSKCVHNVHRKHAHWAWLLKVAVVS